MVLVISKVCDGAMGPCLNVGNHVPQTIGAGKQGTLVAGNATVRDCLQIEASCA